MFEIGQRVKIKDCDAIRETLDDRGRHHTLLFHPFMEKYCGKIAVVRSKEIVNSRITNYTLSGIEYHGVRWYWSEDWLERLEKRPRRRYE
jgi:hypothetical protein